MARISAFFILNGWKPELDQQRLQELERRHLRLVDLRDDDVLGRVPSGKVSISVVLPEPISPVMTTKPSVNQIVDSMYALARMVGLSDR